MHPAKRVCLAVLILVVISAQQAHGQCTCDMTWAPVCGTGVNVAEITHINNCAAECLCNNPVWAPKKAANATCVLRQGECQTFTDDADANGCPMLPAEMTPSHVKYLMDEDDTQFDVVIDVRSKLEFDGIGGEGADDIARNKIGRMPGAILVENLSPDNMTFLENIKCKTAKILVVCASGDRAKAAADLLRANGFSCVFSMDGGMAVWKAMAYPIETGAVASTSLLLAQNDPPSLACPGCTECGMTWEPVCATGVSVAENTHINNCAAQCLCNNPVWAPKKAAGAECVLRQGACQTLTDDADANGCPMLPAEITPSHIKYLMDEDDTQFDVVIDVRSKLEFDGIGGEGADDIARNKIGRMPGAILVENLSPDNMTFLENIKCKTAKILVVCASGDRAKAAADLLRANGFSCVFSMDGGMAVWKAMAYPIETGAVESTSLLLAQNSPPSLACADIDGDTGGSQALSPSATLLLAGLTLLAAAFRF